MLFNLASFLLKQKGLNYIFSIKLNALNQFDFFLSFSATREREFLLAAIRKSILYRQHLDAQKRT